MIVVRRMGGASRAACEPVLQSMGELGATGILLSGSPDEGTVLGRVKPVKSIPGRAQVVLRDARILRAQLVWTEPRTCFGVHYVSRRFEPWGVGSSCLLSTRSLSLGMSYS